MQQALMHRGPDDEGIEVAPAVGLALIHTRLSVIDRSPLGHQPMWNEERTIGLVFNGEIYNFRELRRELEEQGRVFRSGADTEVILQGYEAWGIDVVKRMNGMFAIGLWDNQQKCLWLIRDRLGEKPLYYWHDPARETLVFASEMKALLRWPDISRRVDPEALHCYLTLGYVPAPYSMLQAIRKLQPAHLLRYSTDGCILRRYWEAPALGTWQAPRADYRQAIRATVEQAVARRLVSDVPVGAFLSGGVDSSLVVGVMSRLSPKPVRTFAAAFDVGARSSKYNVDAHMAELVSQWFGTDHTRLTVTATDNLPELLDQIVWHMDEPHANPTLVTTYLLARLTKERGVAVALSGDGSDELFGGYQRYFADRYVSWFRQAPQPMRRALQYVAGRTTRLADLSKALQKAELLPHSPQRYLTWWELFTTADRLELLAPSLRDAAEAPHACIDTILAQAPAANDQDLLSYADLMLWIAEESNMRIDKMGMAHALEIRAPLLDYTVVEQALTIPFRHKSAWGDSKRLLKESFADVLPEMVQRRPKWGWLSPVYYWIKDFVWQEARQAVSWLPETELFSPRVRELVQTYPSPHAHKVWAMFIFALWHRRFIDNV
jgi:asparagine synthase (glutamine-hydrolysing)